MFQLILRNGTVIDPASGLHAQTDLAVENGRIAGIGDYSGERATEIIDASGCLVTPGLIDHHCHLYPLAAIGLPAEAACFASGVTTAVDAGSRGCRNFGETVPFIRQSKLRIRAHLHVCSTGLASLPAKLEDVDPGHFEPEAIRDTLQQYGDILLGLKLRTSRPIVREFGYESLKASVAMGEKLGAHVMVHCTEPPGPIPELLSILRPGDIMTHMYMNKAPHLLDEDGKVCREAYEARDRGVLFETADAREHFSFEVSEAAIREGFYPDILASDLTRFSMHLRPTAFSMANQVAKYTQLGIPFEKVLYLCTAAPAKLMGLENETGALQPGLCADIAVFRREESRIPFGDRPYGNPDGVLRPCSWRLRTMLTVRNGEMVYRDQMF